MQFRLIPHLLWYMLCFVAGQQCVRANNAQGAELVALQPTYTSLEVFKTEHNYDPYFEGTGIGNPYTGRAIEEYWAYGAALKVDFDWLKYGNYRLYSRNNVHMDATNKQVRHVGWEWDNGINYKDKMELFYYHHSRHALEMKPAMAYPLQDKWGVRFILLNK